MLYCGFVLVNFIRTGKIYQTQYIPWIMHTVHDLLCFVVALYVSILTEHVRYIRYNTPQELCAYFMICCILLWLCMYQLWQKMQDISGKIHPKNYAHISWLVVFCCGFVNIIFCFRRRCKTYQVKYIPRIMCIFCDLCFSHGSFQ